MTVTLSLCDCNSVCCSDGPFKLEIPALPVLTGSDVTLRCRVRGGSTIPAYLFKTGERIRSDSKGEFIISNVQQSDEGFYSCSVDLAGETPSSRLRVKGQYTDITSCLYDSQSS